MHIYFNTCTNKVFYTNQLLEDYEHLYGDTYIGFADSWEDVMTLLVNKGVKDPCTTAEYYEMFKQC